MVYLAISDKDETPGPEQKEMVCPNDQASSCMQIGE